jgi:zinc transport system substrate-binding protein
MRPASLLAVLLPLLLAAPARAEAPRVVASIKPVHSLVAAVMEGVATPALLVPGAASPHVYSLKPSDARKLAAARIVFWIGPMYEGFLVKPLAALGGATRVVTLAEAPGVVVLSAREGGMWEEHEDAHEAAGAHADAAHEDGHLWLDIGNAKEIVAAAAAALVEADPEHAPQYQANSAQTTAALDALDARLGAQLTAVAGVPYIVFHDAYQYLELRYGLTAAGSVTVAPERKPGARRIEEIRAKIKDAHVACMFSEPQFEPALVRSIAGDTGVRTGVLDPIGADIPEGPALYGTMMERLAAALVKCLGQP